MMLRLHPLDRPPVASQVHGGLEDRFDEQPVAPDQFLEGFETSKREIWSYCAFYVGNNGMGPFQFAPAAFQNLLAQAAGTAGVLPFAGRLRTINSIVLLSNGLSFSIQLPLLLILGSLADFGTWRSQMLIVQTAIAIAIGFAWLGVHVPSKWEYGAALYIIGLVAYQLALAYWFAAFPGLARNTPVLRQAAEKFNLGEISRDEYDAVDSRKRNEICNMALFSMGFGEIPAIGVGIGLLYGVKSNSSTANNNWGLSVFLAWSSAFWLLMAIPWFILEKKRPGQPLPPGKNIVTAGLWQLRRSATEIWRLKQSLAYLIGFFFLGDALNTTITVINNLQNEVQAYNTILLCELLIVATAAQTVGIYGFMQVQRAWDLSTKTMLNITAICLIMLDVYGMVGAWTQAVGFHHRWEFWLYNVWWGVTLCPWYSYSQTMISEVTPRGKEYLFFSLFNIVGKASSFIGPIICSAIIDAMPSHNTSSPFYFLTPLAVVSYGMIFFFVDLKKSQQEQEKFLNEERKARKGLERG